MTNQFHENVTVDSLHRQTLLLLDGTRDKESVFTKLMDLVKQGELVVQKAGGEMEHLVKVVVYITDVRHREDVYRTMGQYIKGVHPVSTGLVVQALARPEWLVEIDGTAVIPV